MSIYVIGESMDDETNTHERRQRYTALAWMVALGIALGIFIGGVTLVVIYGIVQRMQGR